MEFFVPPTAQLPAIQTSVVSSCVAKSPGRAGAVVQKKKQNCHGVKVPGLHPWNMDDDRNVCAANARSPRNLSVLFTEGIVLG